MLLKMCNVPENNHYMRILTIFTLLWMLLMVNAPMQAQRFKAAAVAGLNASQIDGDKLYGFNKLGLSVGGRLSYANEGRMDAAIEMLYSQRGSAVRMFSNEPGDMIRLDYLELPVLFSVRDWYVEKDGYYKVHAETGMSLGYLFGVETPGYQEEYFEKYDVSWVISCGIRFNKNIGASLRYTTSLMHVYDDPAAAERILKSYFLTLRTELHF